MTTAAERVRGNDQLPRESVKVDAMARGSLWSVRAASAMIAERPRGDRRAASIAKPATRLSAGVGEAARLTVCVHALTEAAESRAAGEPLAMIAPGSLARRGLSVVRLSPCDLCLLAHRIADSAARDIGEAARIRRVALKVRTMAEAAMRDGKPLAALTERAGRLLVTYPTDVREALSLAVERIAESDAVRLDALAYVTLPDRTQGETEAEPTGEAFTLAASILAARERI